LRGLLAEQHNRLGGGPKAAICQRFCILSKTGIIPRFGSRHNRYGEKPAIVSDQLPKACVTTFRAVRDPLAQAGRNAQSPRNLGHSPRCDGSRNGEISPTPACTVFAHSSRLPRTGEPAVFARSNRGLLRGTVWAAATGRAIRRRDGRRTAKHSRAVLLPEYCKPPTPPRRFPAPPIGGALDLRSEKWRILASFPNPPRLRRLILARTTITIEGSEALFSWQFSFGDGFLSADVLPNPHRRRSEQDQWATRSSGWAYRMCQDLPQTG
jgi:hypothetical protein